MGDAPGELFAAGMGRQNSDGATRDAGTDAIGAAGQDDGHSGAEDEAGAVRVCQECELFREHVAGFEVRDEQNVGIAGNRGANAFGFGSLPADGVVEREGAVEDAESDLPAIGHFAERGGIEGGGHLRVDSFDSGQDGDLWLIDAERNREIDGVLADVGFVLEGRGRY